MGTKFVSKPRKLEAVILQTVANCASDNLGAVKLHKVLYYLDMLRFLQFGEPVTGSTYRKRPHGPTCEQLPRALRNLEAAGKLSVSEVAYFGFFKKEYTALEPPPPAELTNGETDLLSQVIDFVCFDKTAKEISEISHALPWELAMDGGEISYESAYLLFPPEESDPDDWAGIEEDVAEFEVKRSSGTRLAGLTLADFREGLRADI